MPSMPWMRPNKMENIAIRGCHLNGIVWIPCLFIIEIEAVNKKHKKVNIPPYIIRGMPKTG